MILTTIKLRMSSFIVGLSSVIKPPCSLNRYKLINQRLKIIVAIRSSIIKNFKTMIAHLFSRYNHYMSHYRNNNIDNVVHHLFRYISEQHRPPWKPPSSAALVVRKSHGSKLRSTHWFTGRLAAQWRRITKTFSCRTTCWMDNQPASPNTNQPCLVPNIGEIYRGLKTTN